MNQELRWNGVSSEYENLTMDLDKTIYPKLQFKPQLIHYKADDSWVEPTLFKMKETLEKSVCPPHAEDCEHGNYLAAAAAATQ